MAKLQKIFKSPQALATWLDGKPLPSNIMAVVLNETGDDIAQIQTSGNNITNVFTKFVTVGDQDVERLQEELEEANATIATQESTIHDLQQDVKEWHDRYDTLYNQYGNLQDQYQQALNEIGHMEDLLDQRDETIATLNATITSQASEIQTLTEQLATANATIASLQADLTNYDNQLQAI